MLRETLVVTFALAVAGTASAQSWDRPWVGKVGQKRETFRDRVEKVVGEWDRANQEAVEACRARTAKARRAANVRANRRIYQAKKRERLEAQRQQRSGSSQDAGARAGSRSGARFGAEAEREGPPPSVESTRPWKDQVAWARRQVDRTPPDELPAAVSSNRDPVVFAALKRAYEEGVDLEEGTLVDALRATGNARVAKAAAFLLARKGTESGRRALADQVARGLACAQELQGFLGPGGEALVAESRRRRARRDELMNRASMIEGSQDREGLAAIDALAAYDDPEVVALLRGLAGDLSEAVQTRAQRALAMQREAVAE